MWQRQTTSITIDTSKKTSIPADTTDATTTEGYRLQSAPTLLSTDAAKIRPYNKDT